MVSIDRSRQYSVMLVMKKNSQTFAFTSSLEELKVNPLLPSSQFLLIKCNIASYRDPSIHRSSWSPRARHYCESIESQSMLEAYETWSTEVPTPTQNCLRILAWYPFFQFVSLGKTSALLPFSLLSFLRSFMRQVYFIRAYKSNIVCSVYEEITSMES